MGEYVTQGLWARAEESEGKVWLKNPVTERSGICLSASTPWQDIQLPQGRRRSVELAFSAQSVGSALVLRVGEPYSALPLEDARRLLEETIAIWHSRCGGLQVETPDEALNHYLSFWGQYQIPVSYTHLDVYKRQSAHRSTRPNRVPLWVGNANGGRCWNWLGCCAPVARQLKCTPAIAPA